MKDLKRILEDHKRWLGGQGGTKADLRGATLAEADLRGANLAEANLRGADLAEANLRGADLREANLAEADLYGANLAEADLYGANLRGADLYWANLCGAKRKGCTLKGLVASTTRSDGHTFFLWSTEQGPRVEAGCRWFTFKEAEAHWKRTRCGTPLGRETMDILRFFRARAKSSQ